MVRALMQTRSNASGQTHDLEKLTFEMYLSLREGTANRRIISYLLHTRFFFLDNRFLNS